MHSFLSRIRALKPGPEKIENRIRIQAKTPYPTGSGYGSATLDAVSICGKQDIFFVKLGKKKSHIMIAF